MERFDAKVEAASVVVTAGASGAFLLLLGMLIDPGDEVFMPDPCYPCNRHFVRLVNGWPRTILVGPDQQYQLTLEGVKTSREGSAQPWRPACLPLQPHWHTGSPEGTGSVLRLAGQPGGFLIIDEIYLDLTYDGPPHSALRLQADNIFVVNCFSKYFCMTVVRLGWIVAPERYMRDIEKLAQNVFICPFAPAQHAALAALHPKSIKVLASRKCEFFRRREIMLPVLHDIGFAIAAVPAGAFYIYADCSTLGADSGEIARLALENSGVAITPGMDFGEHGAAEHVRFA